MSHSRRRSPKARTALTWAALGFVVLQLAVNLMVVARHPELDDWEFGRRLAVLHERRAEGPERPLLLVVGSSRTVLSFQPEILPPLRTKAGAQPLPFNFSHLGAGPGMNLLELRRLLRHGIRPDWLVVEVMPPLLGDERQRILTSTANVRDLSVTRHYVNPWLVYGSFLGNHLVPCYTHRWFLAHSAFPGWVTDAAGEQGPITLGPLGGDSALQATPEPTAAQVQWATELARGTYTSKLQDLHVADPSDRATRDLLDLCRRLDIPVVLLLTPEGSAFRSWYSPQARQRVDDYCAALGRDYGVPLIDARDWLDDASFLDAHHVTWRGAETFTRRLGRDVLQPLVEGKLRVVPPQSVR